LIYFQSWFAVPAKLSCILPKVFHSHHYHQFTQKIVYRRIKQFGFKNNTLPKIIVAESLLHGMRSQAEMD